MKNNLTSNNRGRGEMVHTHFRSAFTCGSHPDLLFLIRGNPILNFFLLLTRVEAVRAITAS